MVLLNRKTLKIELVIVAIIIIGFVISAYHRAYVKSHQPPQNPPTKVEMTTAQAVPWADEIATIGVIAAEQGIMVRAEVSGRVTAIPAHSGSTVAAGDVLIQINPEGMQQQLQHDQAALLLAKTHYDEINAVYGKGYASKADYDQALSNYQQAQAQMAQTREKLQLSQVKAPVAGTLGVVLVNEGDVVNVGQSLISLQNNNVLRVDFSIPAADSDQLTAGLAVTGYANNRRDQKFSGKVYAVDSQVNPNSNTVLVRALLDNSSHKLLPGSFVNVTLILNKQRSTVIVPQTAIVYSTEGTSVYKVINGIVEEVSVHLGQRRGDVVAVTSGVNPGDIIVSIGKKKIRNGSAVVDARKK